MNERISIADFFFVRVLQKFLTLVGKAEQGKFANVFRYMSMIAAQFPVVAKHYGAFEFAETTFVPKAFKVEKPKEEKPAQAAPAKKEKPAKEEEDGDDEPKKEEKKAIKYNYSMDLNAWKRHYKNLNWDDGEDWQPYFYEHFNDAEMSLWLVTYKDP